MQSKVSRRVVLQGLGATVALPWLESGRLFAADGGADDAPPASGSRSCSSATAFIRREWWAKGERPGHGTGPGLCVAGAVKRKMNFINGLQPSEQRRGRTRQRRGRHSDRRAAPGRPRDPRRDQHGSDSGAATGR